jgi:opacity protein-like surface antigen
MKTPIRPLAIAAAGLLSCLLASCAGSADTTAMTAVNATATSRTGQPVIAAVSGGTPRSEVLANITNEDFKQALETSLVKSGLFSKTGANGYRIEAFITSIKQPMVGISMTVGMEVSYVLKKGGSTVWTRSIKSSYTAPVSEAFSGAVRVRKATEGAARENIAQLIQSLDQKL